MAAPVAVASVAAGGASAYEQRRLANIARNEAALLELGLLGAAPGVEAARAARVPRAPARRERREPGVPQRASARLAALPPPDLKEEPDLDMLDRAIDRGGRGRKRARVVGSGSGSGAAEEQDEVAEPDEAGAGGSGALAYSVEAVAKSGLRVSSGGGAATRSSKEIAARVGDADGAWVGKILLPPEGSGSLKEAAMVALGVQRPRFSKYSGIQEFSNSVVLFVNAAPPSLSPGALKQQAKYVNTFFRERAQGPWLMPWFAQARHTAETPVIERLQGREPVLLMCRIPGEAYVCCGRLELREKALERSPIRIVWALTRSEQLDQGSEAWVQLLAFSGCQPVTAQQVKPEVQLA
jgi:hypothetical protein